MPNLAGCNAKGYLSHARRRHQSPPNRPTVTQTSFFFPSSPFASFCFSCKPSHLIPSPAFCTLILPTPPPSIHPPTARPIHSTFSRASLLVRSFLSFLFPPSSPPPPPPACAFRPPRPPGPPSLSPPCFARNRASAGWR